MRLARNSARSTPPCEQLSESGASGRLLSAAGRSQSPLQVLVDDRPINYEEFSSFLLDQLDIPILHFPQGNPFSPRKWPVLSWRSLLRHIYRQSRYWSDLADQQPPGDQLACLLMFLGAAEMMFPPQYEALVDKNKQIMRLEAARDQFNEVLSSIYRHLIEGGEHIVDLTDESIGQVIRDLDRTACSDYRAPDPYRSCVQLGGRDCLRAIGPGPTILN